MKKHTVIKYCIGTGVLIYLAAFAIPDFVKGFIEGFIKGMYGL
ncbi:hypothetical protein [Bacillus sp. Hm123]